MKPLFSETGAARLDEVVGERLLCAFDFDGTLAPLVPVPDEARMPDRIREHLRRLSHLAPIAIITGRGIDDIRPRLGFEPDFLVGNHGMEGVPGWERQSADHAAACAAWRRQLEQLLPAHDPGIMLEDKRYSLSLHYRMAADPAQAAQTLEALFASLQPQPRVVAGKFVYNLLAEDRCHKGSALQRLLEISGARHAIYVGDDVTDEDVFRLRRHDILSVRIEHAATSDAELFIPDAGDIVHLLEELDVRLRRQQVSNWLRGAA
jgi:trehalose 6-phosphate phosphatase